MSVEATPGEFISLANRLRDELIAAGRLTPEGALQIEDSMRVTGLGFDQTAIELGLLTSEDLAEASLRARRRSPSSEPEGIFERVIPRALMNRRLPVKYIGQVKPGPSLLLMHDPDSSYSEKIRALRTELMLLNGGSRAAKVIAVVSACKGEGRTQLCAELAIAFSQLGQRTLLVDADLRSPRIHALFQTENDVGLSQALDANSLPVLFEVDKLPHLSVMIAGASVPNPLELLTDGQFRRLAMGWRRRYSAIIIDTPPISEYADGLAIAACADQTLVVCRNDSTPHQSIKEMLRRMTGAQSKIVGAVINNF